MSARKPPSLVERLLHRVSGRCLVWIARLARRRGDHHEATHCAAALAVGNTGQHHEPCLLTFTTPAGAVTVLAQRMREARP